MSAATNAAEPGQFGIYFTTSNRTSIVTDVISINIVGKKVYQIGRLFFLSHTVAINNASAASS